MVETCDVVVVGAGPAGSIAARELRRAGVGSVLLLDKDEMPRAKPCAGGVGPGARSSLARLGLLEAIDRKAHALTALRLVGPGGRETYVRNTFPATVLPRTELDALLVEAAVREGALFRPRARVERVVERDGRVAGVEVAGGQIAARWMAVAVGCSTPAWPGSRGCLSLPVSSR
jgi:flavin-dependent dehydrogenase